MKNMLVAMQVLLIAACEGSDPYAEKFQSRVAIGDSRSHVIEAMGSPTTVNSIEVPVVRSERLEWEANHGRKYVVFTAMDRVVGKSVIQ